ARDQPELDLRQAHFRVARREPERAGEGELEAAAEGVTVDDRDRGYGQALELVEDGLAELGAALLLGERAAGQLLDVGACTERLVPGAGDEQRPRIAFRHTVAGPLQLLDESERERVQRVRAVQREQGEFLDTLQLDRHVKIQSATETRGRARKLKSEHV